MDFLWDKGFKVLKGRFTPTHAKYDPEFSKYVYDPQENTTTPQYWRCVSKEKCDHAFSGTDEKLRFSTQKALRLAFHDCVPYAGGNYLLLLCTIFLFVSFFGKTITII